MKIRILCLTSLFCCSVAFSMQRQNPAIPPAKEGVAALVGFVLKKCGLHDINTDETQRVLEAFAELTNDPKNKIQDLMQQQTFQTLAARTAEKDYFIDLKLLEAIKNNNAAEIRALLNRCKDRQSIKDVATKYLEEEITANQVVIDSKSK